MCVRARFLVGPCGVSAPSYVNVGAAHSPDGQETRFARHSINGLFSPTCLGYSRAPSQSLSGQSTGASWQWHLLWPRPMPSRARCS